MYPRGVVYIYVVVWRGVGMKDLCYGEVWEVRGEKKSKGWAHLK